MDSKHPFCSVCGGIVIDVLQADPRLDYVCAYCVLEKCLGRDIALLATKVSHRIEHSRKPERDI